MAELSRCQSSDAAARYDEIERLRWMRFALRLAMNSFFHPLDYGRVLMHLGYEPLRSPREIHLMGHPVMELPNVFYYAKYIIQTDGIRGAYVGLVPKVVGNIVGTILCENIADLLGLEEVGDTDSRKKQVDLYYQYLNNLARDMVITIFSVAAYQPFSVISVRMMAQFIGRYGIYESFCESFKEIYVHEGVRGFFAGLTPRLIADLSNVLITSTAAFVMHRYFSKFSVMRPYNAALIQFLISLYLNPIYAVTTCMTVNGSRLMFMPSYSNWIECLRDLGKRSELDRGNDLLCRVPSFPHILLISAAIRFRRFEDYQKEPVISPVLRRWFTKTAASQSPYLAAF